MWLKLDRHRVLISLLDYYSKTRSLPVAARRAGLEINELKTFIKENNLVLCDRKNIQAVAQILKVLADEGLTAENFIKIYQEGGFKLVPKHFNLPLGHCFIIFRYLGIKWQKRTIPWSDEESKRLLKLYKTNSVSNIRQFFSGRSADAIAQHIQFLREKGRLVPRKWSRVDETKFIKLWNRKTPAKDIARKCGVKLVSVSAIRARLKLLPRKKMFPIKTSEKTLISEVWRRGLTYSRAEKTFEIKAGRIDGFTTREWKKATVARINAIGSELFLPSEVVDLAVIKAPLIRKKLQSVNADRDLPGYTLVSPIAVWMAAAEMQYPLGPRQLSLIFPNFSKLLFRVTKFISINRARPDFDRWLSHMLENPLFGQLNIPKQSFENIQKACRQFFKGAYAKNSGFVGYDPFNIFIALVMVLLGRETKQHAVIVQHRKTIRNFIGNKQYRTMYPLTWKIQETLTNLS